MVYSEKFVVVVEVQGRVLREVRSNGGDDVFLPFGSDYSLRLKNLNTRRAVASVTIDGQDVLGGNRVVVEPNGETRVEGHMNADGRVRSAFRFIQKTKEIQDHRGDRLDDGIVRVSWRWEAPPPEVRKVVVEEERRGWRPIWTVPWTPWPHWTSETVYGSPVMRSYNVQCSALNSSRPSADEGITVAGADRHQDFSSVSVGTLEAEEHCVVLRLRGESGVGKVESPHTVKNKLACSTCGQSNRGYNKFCGGCGARLI